MMFDVVFGGLVAWEEVLGEGLWVLGERLWVLGERLWVLGEGLWVLGEGLGMYIPLICTLKGE